MAAVFPGATAGLGLATPRPRVLAADLHRRLACSLHLLVAFLHPVSTRRRRQNDLHKDRAVDRTM
uniref:Uncharacterized protein n=1 Tax=Oryza meridionalis TaxID=40149 RepID=A0A0E0C805_9ORYZ